MELPAGRRPRARHRARPGARAARPADRAAAHGPHRGPRRRHASASATSTSSVDAGELVLLLGQVGSGKSSLLGALAGLVASTGEVRWNGARPRRPRRPTCGRGRVAHVAQVPRVLSGTFRGNVALDHADREVVPALDDGPDGARRRATPVAPTRWSATAAYACPAVRCSAWRWPGRWPATPSCCWPTTCRRRSTRPPRSSSGRRCAQRGATVIGATSKAAALAQADRVVVLVEGRVADSGPWARARHPLGSPGRLSPHLGDPPPRLSRAGGRPDGSPTRWPAPPYGAGAPTATPSTVRSVTTTTIRWGSRSVTRSAATCWCSPMTRSPRRPTGGGRATSCAPVRDPVHVEPSQGGWVAGRPGRRPAYVPSAEHARALAPPAERDRRTPVRTRPGRRAALLRPRPRSDSQDRGDRTPDRQQQERPSRASHHCDPTGALPRSDCPQAPTVGACACPDGPC